ncbi:MAG: ferritin family protein [Candidatus Moraniibacteriota bacterium]
MKTYICEICGDAYLGDEKPHQCPFCGSGKDYIKEGSEARPIINEIIEISEKSRENLMKTLRLEINAVVSYRCMANKTDKYEIKAMYKRLAKVELEHAEIATKLLKIDLPELVEKTCADSDKDNFDETIKLEDNASKLYAIFGQEAPEAEIKKFFAALTVVEKEHIDLIKNYL